MTLRTAVASFLLWLLAASFGGVAAAQSPPAVPADPHSAVESCVANVDGTTVGLSNFESACPGLGAALEAAGIRPLLIDSSRSRINATSLRELPDLIHSSAGPTASVTSLQSVLKTLRATPTAPASWWQRLWNWLASHLGSQQGPQSTPGWLLKFLKVAPQLKWLWVSVMWGTLILITAVVVVIFVREVRATGRRSRDSRVGVELDAGPGHHDSRLALLRQLPMGQRPARLFALLVGRLVAADRLPPARSLTHREVVRKVRLEDAAQRQLIERLARLSERQLYSGAASVPSGIEELLARGEDLYITGWGRPLDP